MSDFNPENLRQWLLERVEEEGLDSQYGVTLMRLEWMLSDNDTMKNPNNYKGGFPAHIELEITELQRRRAEFKAGEKDRGFSWITVTPRLVEKLNNKGYLTKEDLGL